MKIRRHKLIRIEICSSSFHTLCATFLGTYVNCSQLKTHKTYKFFIIVHIIHNALSRVNITLNENSNIGLLKLNKNIGIIKLFKSNLNPMYFVV